MPTGYTADVADGTVTDFREFALRCARGMGALIMMRDEPLDAPVPERFEPSQFSAEVAARCRRELQDLKQMSDDECAMAADRDFVERHSSWADRRSRRQEQRERYESMLTQVQAYEPPSPAHNGFKEFMISQLEDSIRFDCSFDCDNEPQRVEWREWWASKLESLREQIERAEQSQLKENQRTEERNEWVRKLRESLEVSAVIQ